MKQIKISLDEDLIADLEAQAKMMGRSLSEQARLRLESSMYWESRPEAVAGFGKDMSDLMLLLKAWTDPFGEKEIDAASHRALVVAVNSWLELNKPKRAGAKPDYDPDTLGRTAANHLFAEKRRGKS